MPNPSLFTILLSFLVSISTAQTVNFSGIITNALGSPVPEALVQLESCGQSVTTGADGLFSINGPVKIKKSPNTHQAVNLHMGLLHINLAEKSAIQISVYSISGKLISTEGQIIEAGNHPVALSAMESGVFMYQIKTNHNLFSFKSVSMNGMLLGTGQSAQSISLVPLSKQAIEPKDCSESGEDVITVTKEGYENFSLATTTLDTSGMALKLIGKPDKQIWEPGCPEGFDPESGSNLGFSSNGDMRRFDVLLPSNTDSPRPVFVSLTGTVQDEVLIPGTGDENQYGNFRRKLTIHIQRD